MLSTSKLIQLANQNFDDNYPNSLTGVNSKVRPYDRVSYLSGYYDGYLMGQPKKRKSKTTTGKLATVGVSSK